MWDAELVEHARDDEVDELVGPAEGRIDPDAGRPLDEAPDGASGLRILDARGRPFDAIVVDFNMVGPNGAWLLRQVRDRYPHIERILLSGSSYSDLSPYLDPGLVDRFIEKPLEVDELIEAVSGSS